MGFKITKIDQANSKYSGDDGLFNFILSGIPDNRWRECFSKALNGYSARHFKKHPVIAANTDIIEIYAQIHGDHNLKFVSEVLVQIIDEVNEQYDKEIKELEAEEIKKKKAKADLDAEVAKQISAIKF